MSERLLAQATRRCRHFNGVHHKTCNIGIAYEDVKGPKYALPCISDPNAPTCESRSLLTRAEAEAEEAESAAIVKAYLDDLASDRCPICHQPITKRQQVGRCVYGEPCGHRLYQGTLPKEARR